MKSNVIKRINFDVKKSVKLQRLICLYLNAVDFNFCVYFNCTIFIKLDSGSKKTLLSRIGF